MTLLGRGADNLTLLKKKRFHHTCVRSEHVLIQLYESIAVPGFCRLLLLNDDDDDDDD